MTSYERISVTVPADIAQQVRQAAEQATEIATSRRSAEGAGAGR